MAKGIMYIDGQRVPFDGEKNVLAVIRKAGIDMPTFCYYSELICLRRLPDVRGGGREGQDRRLLLHGAPGWHGASAPTPPGS